MNILFRPLFTLAVAHTYYEGGVCRDFRLVVPESTAAELRRGRMIARELNGRVHVLYEAHAATGLPRVVAAGVRLRFGLRFTNPYFSNFTDTGVEPAAYRPRFSNAAAATELERKESVRLVGDVYSHTLGGAARPATVTLRDDAGAIVAEAQEAEELPTVTFRLDGLPHGAYEAAEVRPGGTRFDHLYRDPELLREDPAVIVDVTVGEGFYATPPALVAPFAAREEVLSYYVVARKYGGSPELEAMAVTEANPAVLLADRIVFERFEEDEFPEGALDPSLVAGGDPVVLFRSQTPIPRRERGRRRIQLGTLNDEVLVANLPQPGPEQARADVIVHLTKP